MSGFLQSLVSADDSCGPVNPLSSLVKGVHGEGSQLGRDRFSAIAGPSGSQAASGFRTHSLHPSESQADSQARAFFEQQQHQSRSHSHSPYNLDAIHRALPPSAGAAHSHSPAPAWAADFMAFEVERPASGQDLSKRAWEKTRAVERPASAPMPGWATDFTRQHQHRSDVQHVEGPQLQQQMATYTPAMHMIHPMHNCTYQAQGPAFSTYNAMPMQEVHQPRIHNQSKVEEPVSTVNWETAFLQHLEQQSPTLADRQLPSSEPKVAAHQSVTARPHSPSQLPQGNEQDMLSRTAGELLHNVSHDLQTNDKLRESSFMRLMQKLRDKEVTVQGDQMVDGGKSGTSEAVASQPDMGMTVPVDFSRTASQPICVRTMSNPGDLGVKMASFANRQETDRHTPELEELQAAYDEMNIAMDEDYEQRLQRSFVGDGGAGLAMEAGDGLQDARSAADIYRDAAVLGASSAWEEDFDFDTDLLRSGPAPPTMEQMLATNPQQAEWATMQDQYESFAATSSGIQANQGTRLTDYPFHSRNPYLLNMHHRQHLPANTLLEKEADVQHNPQSPLAWLNLGLKQQENEREALAIQALQRALELDPQLQDAWLALAVSYTNDNMRLQAYEAINKWVDCKQEYAGLVPARKNAPDVATSSTSERHRYLTNLLVQMARTGNRAGYPIVDADVQIALGVLFNSSEEYDKAGDCFMSALSVRPNDPHLYNRLGATLANSGKAADALEYYYRALDLQPDFARATFNLAIACINLNAHEEAASHLLRALRMQLDNQTDADVGEPSLVHLTEQEMVQHSTLLWDTLATCCTTLGRPELASACHQRNIVPFDKTDFVREYE